MKIEHIAKIAHEANKAYAQTIGDFSHVSWEDAPEAQRESSIKGIYFLLDNPTASPEQQHEAWMKHKVEQGYHYGEKKDDKLKTHDCLMPYSMLPEHQRIKDYLYQAVTRTLLRFVASIPYGEVKESITKYPAQ